jgi:CCR4-NOT transcription complex subunit 4
MADNDNFNDQDEYESSEEESKEETTCPLCVEEMDLSDKNFLPCPCGYRVCMWCWHHIRENLNGLCPACRTPYNADPHAFSAVNTEE